MIGSSWAHARWAASSVSPWRPLLLWTNAMAHQFAPTADPSPRPRAFCSAGSRSARRPLLSAPRDQDPGAVLDGGDAGCMGDRVDLVDQHRRGVERAGVHVQRGTVGGDDRQCAQRARLTRDAYAAGHERVPELVVPEVLREPAREPEPAA